MSAGVDQARYSVVVDDRFDNESELSRFVFNCAQVFGCPNNADRSAVGVFSRLGVLCVLWVVSLPYRLGICVFGVVVDFRVATKVICFHAFCVIMVCGIV